MRGISSACECRFSLSTYVMLNCPRHDATRERQTRALTSTTEPADRSSDYTECNPDARALLRFLETTRTCFRLLREYGDRTIMSMLANSERIIVEWPAKFPSLPDLSAIELYLPPSLMRHLVGYRIVVGLISQGRTHKFVQ